MGGLGAHVLPSLFMAAAAVTVEGSTTDNIQPLSTLKMQAAQVAMDSAAVIHASPDVLGKNVSTQYKRKTCCWVGSSTREASLINVLLLDGPARRGRTQHG